jgi:hypothetical protein
LYGLARLLDLIINAERGEKIEILLKDCGLYYELELEDYAITEQDVIKFSSNPQIGFDYIYKSNTKMPSHPETGEELSLNYIDIQKEWGILKNKSSENSENTQTVSPDFSTYALLSHFAIEFTAEKNMNMAKTTQSGMVTRTFLQIFLNRYRFKTFITAILETFST